MGNNCNKNRRRNSFEDFIILNVQNTLKCDLIYEGIECPICLIEFDFGDDLFKTLCNHVFHYHCILDWSKRKSECPCCRSYINI